MNNSRSKFIEYLSELKNSKTGLGLYKSTTINSYAQGVADLGDQINEHLKHDKIGSLYNVSNSRDLLKIYSEWISVNAIIEQEKKQHNRYTNAFRRYVEYIENKERIKKLN